MRLFTLFLCLFTWMLIEPEKNALCVCVCVLHETFQWKDLDLYMVNDNQMILPRVRRLHISVCLGRVWSRVTITSVWSCSAWRPCQTCSLSRTSTPKPWRDVRRPRETQITTSERFNRIHCIFPPTVDYQRQFIIYIYIYIYMYVCVCVCIYIYIYIYVYVCVCVCVYMCANLFRRCKCSPRRI